MTAALLDAITGFVIKTSDGSLIRFQASAKETRTAIGKGANVDGMQTGS